jgi:TonB family protein
MKSMKTQFAGWLVWAMLAVAWPLPGSAQESAEPATLEQVREKVELYYQTHQSRRPSPAWLASHAAPTCSTPRYPRAGLLDELEGTTILSFRVGADGKAEDVRLEKSSRWAVLDEAAFESLALCVLKPETGKERPTVSYRFYLN